MNPKFRNIGAIILSPIFLGSCWYWPFIVVGGATTSATGFVGAKFLDTLEPGWKPDQKKKSKPSQNRKLENEATTESR